MKANRLKLAKELQRTAEAKEITAEAKCHKDGYNTKPTGAPNHRATDRTEELAAPPDATLAKRKPLWLTFFLCNESMSIAPEYTEVLCTRKTYVLINKPNT